MAFFGLLRSSVIAVFKCITPEEYDILVFTDLGIDQNSFKRLAESPSSFPDFNDSLDVLSDTYCMFLHLKFPTVCIWCHVHILLYI